MKNLKIIICSALFVLCISLAVFAEGITVQLEFPQDSLTVSKMGEYDVVSLEGCELFGEPGEPLLPTKAVYVALPPGFEMTGVRISDNRQIQLPGAFDIAPGQPVRPVSQPDLYDFVPPEPSAYSLFEAQPAEQLVSTGEGSLRGYRVLGLIVYPMQYQAAEKRLLLSTEMTIEIVGKQLPLPLDTLPESTLAGDVAAKSVVSSLVENPEGAEQQPRATPLYWRDKCDVLIITQDYFVSSLEVLQDWLYRKGYRTKIVTVGEIEGDYVGPDLPAKIRNCIKDYYINQGLGWVILGGDVGEVPTRRGYAFTSGKTYGKDDYLQCDYYYSDLDGSWNADGDEYWGEYKEDNIDMYPDVFVGRLPASSLSNIKVLVRKILTYEGVGEDPLPTDYLTSAFFWACKLDEHPTWGGDAKDSITEATIFPPYWTFKTCYDRDGTSGKENVLGAMDDGYAIINNCGHSTYNAASALSDVPNAQREYIACIDMTRLKNSPRYSVLYSIGCLFGALDLDSLGERFVNAAAGGGVAALVNSRYGWYSSGSPGYGPSDLMDREFFDALFRGHHYNIGEAFAESKVRYISYSKRSNKGWYGCFRWVTYGMNLLGSPVTPVWTATPSTIAVDYDPVFRLNRDGFFASVTGKGAKPVQGALVCLTDRAGWLARGTTDQDGQVLVDTPYVESARNFDLTVTAQNHLPYLARVTGVYNTELALTNAEVTPRYGRAGDTFTFQVHYSDEDGDPPFVIKAYVAGQYFPLSLLEGGPANGTFGVKLVIGSGDCLGDMFHFFAVDGRGSFKRYPPTGELFGPGIDDVKPDSTVSSPQYSSVATIAVQYLAHDDCSGAASLELWFRRNAEAWTFSGLSGEGSSGTISFVAPAEGTYDFFSIATDNAGNEQLRIARTDTSCVYDGTPPSSTLRCPDYSSESNLSIACWAGDVVSGVERVTMYYRFSAPEPAESGIARQPKWQVFKSAQWRQGLDFAFDAQNGPGLYEFMSIATDRAGNTEHVKSAADASCVFDYPSLAFFIWTDAGNYHPGDELVVSGAYDNPGETTTADLYLALVLPDGDMLYMPGPSNTLCALYTEIPIAALSSREFELLRTEIPAGFLPGRYQFMAALVRSSTYQLMGNIAAADWDVL
ncbi:MAG TPA: C25 family cysteine peptidase [bacterium]|nr:C25 family cysteine peptidase [bacterium]